MSRSRTLLTVLAMSLLTAGCQMEVEKIDAIKGCKDLSVGEQNTLEYETHRDVSLAWWTHSSGPGTLEGYRSEQAHYTATEAGSVVIIWNGVTPSIEVLGEFKYPSARLVDLCEFEVFDATVTPAELSGYEVTAVVTVSTVEGLLFQIGAESTATWRLVFDCPDGRCDAEVHDGGPYGGLAPFLATYQADMENFVFDFVLDTPANETCGDDRWVGEITPLGWDDQGPVGFTFTMVNVLTCDTGDLVVEWEGEATRG